MIMCDNPRPLTADFMISLGLDVHVRKSHTKGFQCWIGDGNYGGCIQCIGESVFELECKMSVISDGRSGRAVRFNQTIESLYETAERLGVALPYQPATNYTMERFQQEKADQDKAIELATRKATLSQARESLREAAKFLAEIGCDEFGEDTNKIVQRTYKVKVGE